MKIIDLRVRTVAIPLTCQLRRNEFGGGGRCATLTKLKPRIVRMGPFPLESIKPGSLDLDVEESAKYERGFEKRGDCSTRFHEDPKRPDWYPVVGGI